MALIAVVGVPASARAAVPVPAAIDATGRTDVTAELRRFVDSVPDGRTIVFPRRATYRIDGTLEWDGRTGLTLEGNGARLVAGTHGNPYRAHVRLVDGGDWTIRNLAVTGANPHGGRFDPADQWQHGVALLGVDGATLRNVSVSEVFGDDIYIGLSPKRQRWSQDVSIVDCTGRRSGRMAIAITAGRRITVDGGRWSQPGLSTFDVEPNGRPGGVQDVVIENTVVGAGASDRVLDITGSGPVSHVTLRDNRLTGRPLSVRADQGDERPRDIVVEGNRSTVTFAGPGPAAMVFRNTDGVTVSGNTQRLKPGANLAMVATQGSTRVDVSGQSPYRKLRRSNYTPLYVVGCLAAAALFLAAYRRRAR